MWWFHQLIKMKDYRVFMFLVDFVYYVGFSKDKDLLSIFLVVAWFSSYGTSAGHNYYVLV